MASDPIVARYRQRLTELSPEAFEDFIGDLWAREGWATEVTQARADRGIDVKATRGGVARQTALIQAKRYRGDNKVRPADVREYAGVRQRERDADMMVLVTTGAATSGAREEAAELNVELIEGTSWPDGSSTAVTATWSTSTTPKARSGRCWPGGVRRRTRSRRLRSSESWAGCGCWAS